MPCSDDTSAAGLAIVKNSSLGIVLSLSIRPRAFSHSLCQQVSSCFVKLGELGGVEVDIIISCSFF